MTPPESVEVEFIAPRHLAGGGDPAWITVPLHRASGWSYGHDPLMPRVILSSPDQSALLRLEPVPDGQWWTLQHAATRDRPAWSASFGARTPVEIIAGFTDALTDPAVTAATTDPFEPLAQAGWAPADRLAGHTSPDGTAMVQRLDDEGAWFATATLTGPQVVWQARFGEHAPPHLLTAFTAALADPDPLPRTDTFSLPTGNPNLVTCTHQEVPAAQVASALEERVEALTARRSAPSASPSVPQRPPAGNGRSR